MNTQSSVIICPKCGAENAAGAQNCIECRVNLAWALDNPAELRAEVARAALDAEVHQYTELTMSNEQKPFPWYIKAIIGAVAGAGTPLCLIAGITTVLGGQIFITFRAQDFFEPIISGAISGAIGALIITWIAGKGGFEVSKTRQRVLISILGGVIGLILWNLFDRMVRVPLFG